MRRTLKELVNGVCLALVLIPAAASGFGRLEAVFIFFAHLFAMLPGIPGDYVRIAYYRLTLTECSLSSRVSFGSFFAHSDANVGPNVYLGPYCVIGKASIGQRTQIASGVQILSGRRQHTRGGGGEISGSEQGQFSKVSIGHDCWIGASAIVMADVGAGSTVGAGSVVTREIPADSVAVGSPARVITSAATAAGGATE